MLRERETANITDIPRDTAPTAPFVDDCKLKQEGTNMAGKYHFSHMWRAALLTNLVVGIEISVDHSYSESRSKVSI